MAQRARAFADNAPGDFFVDASCIDCETCYALAPEIFEDAGSRSRVHRQPRTASEGLRASLAVVACPTASIGARDVALVAEASRSFPVAISGEVGFCGFTSPKSYGAWSYFVERSEGNVLVDCPRAAEPLLKNLEERGGVALMVLSHRDDVADHARMRQRLGLERIIHRADRVGDFERLIEGETPVELASDLLLIPVPGHTRGSMCLLYRGTYLFTGDHLWWDEDRGMLWASRSVNWYSWPEQVKSLRKLLDFDFRWVLPGHGRVFQAKGAQAMRAEIQRTLKRLEHA